MSRNEITVKMHNNKFSGDLSYKMCERIEKVRSNKEIPAFTQCLYDFPVDFRQEAKALGCSALDLAIERDVLDLYVGRLRDYQTVGAAFLWLSHRSMLGDAAGIGKTPQICAMINKMRKEYKPELGQTVWGNTQRILLAAEKSAVGQIAAEVERFTGLKTVILSSIGDKMSRQVKSFYVTQQADKQLLEQLSELNESEAASQTVADVQVLGKTKKTTGKKKPVIIVDFDVLVISHSTLRSDTFFTWYSRVMHEFSTFILDESYVVKNPNTVIYSYTQALCEAMARVHFLNATVFETKLMDVVNQFSLCTPRMLPPKSWIERRFCVFKRKEFLVRGGKGLKKSAWELVNYQNQEIFKNAMQYVYLTRKKKDVDLGSTERFYAVYLISPTKVQKSAIRDGYRYNEVLNCPSMCTDIGILNEVSHVPKLARLLELLDENYEDRQVMIYVWHIEMQHTIKTYLEKAGRRPIILNGGTDDKDGTRNDVRDEFNNGTYDVIITNIKRSLNLYVGDVCIFYSVETNPAAVEQIAARIDRNVDEKAKEFVLLAYEGAEADFFINTVRQRAIDGTELADTLSETVDEFGRLLLECTRQ